VELEQLVTAVVRAVVRALGQEETAKGNPPPPACGRLVALITGGLVGAEEAFAALERLLRRGYQLDVVLSKSAVAIHSPDALRARLPGVRLHLAVEMQSPHQLLSSCDLVVVPIMTRHTAARTALLLSDTLPVSLILDALLRGKPVVAARDAADLSLPGWRGQARGNVPSGLRTAMEEVLQRLASMGVELVEARQLYEAVERRLAAPAATEARVPDGSSRLSRQVITAEAVRMAAMREDRTLDVRGAIVTPLARDLARQLGVHFVEEVGQCTLAR